MYYICWTSPYPSAPHSYEQFNDFGASDVPLSNSQWKELQSDEVVAKRGKVIQLPIGLAPMNFFVSIPESVLPGGKIQLTPCTIVKIFSVSRLKRRTMVAWRILKPV